MKSAHKTGCVFVALAALLFLELLCFIWLLWPLDYGVRDVVLQAFAATICVVLLVILPGKAAAPASKMRRAFSGAVLGLLLFWSAVCLLTQPPLPNAALILWVHAAPVLGGVLLKRVDFSRQQ